jgi:hypothetical protein
VDRIIDFGRDDVIVTDQALRDPNNDGIITVGANGSLVLDRVDGDRVVLVDFNAGSGLEFLGEQDGLFFYGYEDQAPAIAGILGGNPTLHEDLRLANAFALDSGSAEGQMLSYVPSSHAFEIQNLSLA